MYRWHVDDPGVTMANLNSALSPWDAVVDASVGTAEGGLYPTVTEALAAGNRTIFVKSGAYSAGFTVTAAMVGAKIIGEEIPYMPGSTMTNGPRFAGQIKLEAGASGVTLENLGVHTTSAGVPGFHITDTNWTTLVNCVAGSIGAGGTGWGFWMPGVSHARIIDCRARYCGSGGINFQNGGTYSGHGNFLTRFRSYFNQGPGFGFGDQNETRVDTKRYSLTDCLSSNDCQSWGSGGFSIGPRNHNISLVGCRANEAQSSAAGFFFHAAPSALNIGIISACTARNNTGAGFRMEGGHAGTTTITGCVSYSNTGLEYDNCSGLPGYSTCA